MSSPVHLVNLDTDEALPDITEAEFEFLNEHLEQESEDDDDYYVDQATIEMLADAGAPCAFDCSPSASHRREQRRRNQMGEGRY